MLLASYLNNLENVVILVSVYVIVIVTKPLHRILKFCTL